MGKDSKSFEEISRKMKIADIFLVLTSIGVDLQINSRTVNEEVKLLKKILRQIKKECTNMQKRQYKKYFGTLNQIIGEIEDYQKQKKEYVNKYIQQLEGELVDLKTIDELEQNLEKYRKWKEKISLDKKKKVLELQQKVKNEIEENNKIKGFD